MFAIVRCEYPLPLPNDLGECKKIKWAEIEFQAKPFAYWEDGLFEEGVYSIEEDGQIYLEKVEKHWKEDESHPFGGQVELRENGVEKLDYTGEISFYSGYAGKKHDYFIEFKALFWKGDLKEISLEDWSKEGNEDRIETQKKIKEVLEKKFKLQKKWSKPFYKFLHKIISGVFFVPKWILTLMIRAVLWLEGKILNIS